MPLTRPRPRPVLRCGAARLTLGGALGGVRRDCSVAFSRTLRAGPGQHRIAWQRHAKAHGRTNTAETTRQHAALSHVARADAAMEKLLAEEAAEQAKEQARSKKSKKKNKAGRDEPSEAPPASAPALPLAAAPEPAVALTAAPRVVQEGGTGAEARARCDRLLETQQETEREARQEAAAEAARLALAERAREVVAWEAERAAAASKAREVVVAAAAAVAAVVEAAAAAEAEVDALERATADGGEGGCSGAAGPRSEASEVAVPDQYVCPITAEIMTDPLQHGAPISAPDNPAARLAYATTHPTEPPLFDSPSPSRTRNR
eukprot:scaffold105518_cov59-Phaeocystis_antarctica.AAC.2